MTAVHWMKADGSVEVTEETKLPDREKLMAFVGGDIEFAWVLFKEKRACMIVNEIGALIPLPVNKAATEIYHESPKRRGILGDDPPQIHGDVVLCEAGLVT